MIDLLHLMNSWSRRKRGSQKGEEEEIEIIACKWIIVESITKDFAFQSFPIISSAIGPV